jgi:hypothetical protein
MFLSSYGAFRRALLESFTFTSLIQLEYNAFEPACVPVCCFSVSRNSFPGYFGRYIKLSEFKGHENQPIKTLEAIRNPNCGWMYSANQNEFQHIPGSPFAYWASSRMRTLFQVFPQLGTICEAQKGLATCDSARFVRHWWEVNVLNIGRAVTSCEEAKASKCRWFMFNKGGDYRRWYGNVLHVVNWESDGAEIKATIAERYPYLKGNTSFVTQDTSNYFRPAVVWTYLSSNDRSFRLSPGGEIASNASQCAYTSSEMTLPFLGYLNTPVIAALMRMVSPTLNSNLSEFLSLPFPKDSYDRTLVTTLTQGLVSIAKEDWDSQETSVDFRACPTIGGTFGLLSDLLSQHIIQAEAMKKNAIELESQVNEHFVRTMGLEGEIDPYNDPASCVLHIPQADGVCQDALSYAIGCMMGRYSLDKPGLIYAHSGNQGFDPSQYKTFRADDDGIIPLLETDWGIRDDAANRIVEFVGVAWPKEHLQENLKFIADGLGPNNGEQPRDTIRRFLATGFYRHHLSMYRKRPIYWLFSSGKQRAFQCLVYLHRYHEGTLARMRTEYVIPLQGQIAARIEQLEGDKAKATSTSHRRKLQKEQDDLKKRQAELATFEEKLKHAADQKISLDLDDGVKVNYAKVGDLLAESKSITGGSEE